MSIQPGGDVALGSGDFLMRNSGLKYNSIILRCPEMSASQGQVQEIEKTVINEVKVISADLSSALEEELKKAW